MMKHLISIIIFSTIIFNLGETKVDLWKRPENEKENHIKIQGTDFQSFPVAAQDEFFSKLKKIMKVYTSALIDALKLSEKIVISGFKLEDYYPGGNTEASNLWRKTVNLIFKNYFKKFVI